MSRNFLLADFIAHIKNSISARLKFASFFYSNLIENVCNILKEDGYIDDYSIIYDELGKKNIKVVLSYHKGISVIQNFFILSKPSRRLYVKFKNLNSYKNGMGLIILSTSKGVISYKKASEEKIGGEILCCIF
jgi:small subunit ribosomal protein S8